MLGLLATLPGLLLVGHGRLLSWPGVALRPVSGLWRCLSLLPLRPLAGIDLLSMLKEFCSVGLPSLPLPPWSD
jgi:hypothetical protein